MYLSVPFSVPFCSHSLSFIFPPILPHGKDADGGLGSHKRQLILNTALKRDRPHSRVQNTR